MKLHGLGKRERLRGKKRVEAVFASDKSGFCYPFRYIYRTEAAGEAEAGVAVLVSVPKRNHKRAVVRNLLKRRTREAFRLRKNALGESAVQSGRIVEIALLYVAKEQLEFNRISHAVEKILGEIEKGA